MNNFPQTLGQEAEVFLDEVFKDLKSTNIDVSEFELDHICYRVETQERYQEIKDLMNKIGDLLSETIISNRPIATYKLKNPIEYNERDISVIEVPSPKEGSFYTEGFEHAEFVINEELNSFMMLYPDVMFNTSSINKPINPEISIKLRNSRIKFHEQSLETVCEMEKNLNLGLN